MQKSANKVPPGHQADHQQHQEPDDSYPSPATKPKATTTAPGVVPPIFNIAAHPSRLPIHRAPLSSLPVLPSPLGCLTKALRFSGTTTPFLPYPLYKP